MLSQIKHYLQLHQCATLQDLAIHFATEPDAMRGMVEHWIRKGAVRKQTASACHCQGCSGCGARTFEIYEWIPACR